MHAAVEFDTVAPPLDGEQQLYAKLGVSSDRHAGTSAQSVDSSARQRRERHEAACESSADSSVDVAASRLTSASDEAASAATAQQSRQQVRQREQACVSALSALYNFRSSDFDDDASPSQGERWGMDSFHPQALKDMGVQVGMGAAAGAMAGAAVDSL
ncbi:hypothetical protein OY671_011862, partial [Metschnikowia pulcherrima]